MSLDNSSCNLASLNLLKSSADDRFDAERSRSRRADHHRHGHLDLLRRLPDAGDRETTRDYRQLGIGYANLGALLMARPRLRLRRRSRAGRRDHLADDGCSYRRSAELAAIVGPYAGYARNADAHKRVMRKHQAANDALRAFGRSTPICTAGHRAWDGVVKLGEANGFRNAQARVLAPTGTIGFMMDCDTTGSSRTSPW